MTYMKYPPSTECNDINKFFESVEDFKEHAEEDKEATMLYKGRGYYQCYCKKHSSVEILLDMNSEDIC